MGPQCTCLEGRGQVRGVGFRREAKSFCGRTSGGSGRVLLMQKGAAAAAAEHAVETQVCLETVRVSKRPPAVPADVALLSWARDSGKVTL